MTTPIEDLDKGSLVYKACQNDACVSSAPQLLRPDSEIELSGDDEREAIVIAKEIGTEESVLQLVWNMPRAQLAAGDVYTFTIEDESSEPLLDISTTVERYDENYVNVPKGDRPCWWAWVNEP